MSPGLLRRNELKPQRKEQFAEIYYTILNLLENITVDDKHSPMNRMKEEIFRNSFQKKSIFNRLLDMGMARRPLSVDAVPVFSVFGL